MVEIGKKAPKLRRLPQRRREQLPPKSNADTAWRELCGRDSVGRSGTKAHEDVTDHAAKRWDDDWRESYEQLSADASKMEMETIKKASPAGFPLQKVTLWDIFSRPQFGTRRGRVGRWS